MTMFVSQKDFIILYQSSYYNNIFHLEFSTYINLNSYLLYKKTNLNAIEIPIRIRFGSLKIPPRIHTNLLS